MLFHYHMWTPFVEETERFYKQLGFQVTQRIGKHDGDFTAFNPPLDWDDFRHQHILFRIIEMKKAQSTSHLVTEKKLSLIISVFC
ncbi:hypothetical protein ACNOIU_08090 [Exiguobacterium mexicanum]|uniref:Glyoxalase n=1 Tax=Exiguobacterium mexicanum TaxID=340146 RepID=A0ABT7ML44_9BACL|nr:MULTISPECIES: hypothetical protein [Exiguobacterium]MDL5376130.1 hypothetical protein [Exiguobacterium mexicanum]